MNAIWPIGLIWLLSWVVIVIPKKRKALFTLLVSLGFSILSSRWAVVALAGNTVMLHGPQGLTAEVDALSAMFMLIINFTVLTGAFYAMGYLRSYGHFPDWLLSLHGIAYSTLHLSMLSVVMFQRGFPFLTAWEMMALSSFILVIFEADKATTLRTGIMYLLQMHIGFFFLLGGFLWMEVMTGEMGFSTLSAITKGHDQAYIFLVLAMGFGIKAGFIPLHTWLPHAHPAAPSHVSAVMSGVMIKTGIYGIMRLLMYVNQDLLVLGIVLVTVSVVTGVWGITLAAVQKDLKKALAYSSIENIGIIGLGLGLGVVGSAVANPQMAVLGYSAALLHILNHSLFKSLLFYAAGAVYQLTGTRNLAQLGGLIKSMPQTAGLFLVGALAISGFPPFNGFVSEYLIYRGLFHGLGANGLGTNLLLLGALTGLVLIGGLTVFSFTRLFGVTFQGTPRSAAAGKVNSDIPFVMRMPMYIIAGVMFSIGVFPHVYWHLAVRAVSVYGLLPADMAAIPATLSQVGMTSAIFVMLIGVLWGIRYRQQQKVVVERGPAWGCGYTGADPALHQYSATSYAANYVELVEPIVNVSVQYTPFAEDEVFPGARSFKTHQEDPVEAKLMQPFFVGLIKNLEKLAILQTGKIQHYLVYPLIFLGLIVILTLLKWI